MGDEVHDASCADQLYMRIQTDTIAPTQGQLGWVVRLRSQTIATKPRESTTSEATRAGKRVMNMETAQGTTLGRVIGDGGVDRRNHRVNRGRGNGGSITSRGRRASGRRQARQRASEYSIEYGVDQSWGRCDKVAKYGAHVPLHVSRSREWVAHISALHTNGTPAGRRFRWKERLQGRARSMDTGIVIHPNHFAADIPMAVSTNAREYLDRMHFARLDHWAVRSERRWNPEALFDHPLPVWDYHRPCDTRASEDERIEERRNRHRFGVLAPAWATELEAAKESFVHSTYPALPGWLKNLEVSRVMMVGTNVVDAHCGLALKASSDPDGYLWHCWRVLFAQAVLGEMLTVASGRTGEPRLMWIPEDLVRGMFAVGIDRLCNFHRARESDARLLLEWNGRIAWADIGGYRTLPIRNWFDTPIFRSTDFVRFNPAAGRPCLSRVLYRDVPGPVANRGERLRGDLSHLRVADQGVMRREVRVSSPDRRAIELGGIPYGAEDDAAAEMEAVHAATLIDADGNAVTAGASGPPTADTPIVQQSGSGTGKSLDEGSADGGETTNGTNDRADNGTNVDTNHAVEAISSPVPDSTGHENAGRTGVRVRSVYNLRSRSK